jgi:hypothetical protein|tara:strand:+ start:1732 stop:1923 length:192 start_codon:yes stop_codon:yes gene_type:complete
MPPLPTSGHPSSRQITGAQAMKITIELSDADAEEMVELGQQLLTVVERLEELAKRIEDNLDAD